MPYEDLADWLKAVPLAPFRVILSNGTVSEIHQPGHMWPGRQSVLFGFPSGDDPWGTRST